MTDYESDYISLKNANCTQVNLPEAAYTDSDENQKHYYQLAPINSESDALISLPGPSNFNYEQNFSLHHTDSLPAINPSSLLNSDKSQDINHEPRLLKILKLHPHGLNVLNFYNLNKTLNKSTRNLLGRLVLYKEHEGKSTVECLPASRYVELASEICKIFRSEVEGTYYTPHSGASGGAATQCARGLLLACNNYLRGQFLKKIKIPKQTTLTQIDSEEPSNVLSESLNFVQKYLEPWEEVVHHWKNSYADRQKESELNKSSIGDYFKKFSCLKQIFGYELLEHDFNLKFPEKKDAFKKTWPVVRKQLIYLFSGPRKPTEPEFQALALSLQFLKDDALDLAIFLLLSAAFPKPKCITNKIDISSSKSRKKAKKSESEKGWNPTKPEARGGFIFNVKTANDVLVSLNQLQNTLANYNLPLQPRPVIVGCVNNIISSHIIINEVQYDFESSARAVEVAFKTYYALNAQYPPEAKSAWIFIEQAVFKLGIQPSQLIPTSVKSLIGELSIDFDLKS